MRTTNIYIDDKDHERLINTVGLENLQQALGRLSTWGLSYPICDITVADFRDGELIAVYRRERGKDPAFVMAAVFDTTSKTYSFHS